MKKRILCLFLSLLFCLSLLPAAGAAEGRENGDVWSAIEALERDRLPARPTAADYEELIPQVEALVLSRDDTVPDSVCHREGTLLWRTTDGTACGYDPELRTQINSAVPMPEADRIAAEREADRAADLSGEETAVLMSGDTGSKDVAVFIPWWGEDSDFLLTTYYLGVQLADAMGGSCKRYLGKEATLDELSNALSTCRMVFIHTHGGDGTVTLLSDKGITSQDYEDYHVTKSGSGICSVDGQAIRNHLNGPVVTDYFSMNSCLGMAAERMEAPLREAGVKAVFGFSQSVTFAYDITYTRFLISGLLQGKTVAEAVSEAHRQIADFVLEWFRTNEALAAMLKEKGAIYWDPWQGNGASTPEQARENKAAFPILVSEQDPYPGLEHKDEIQNVKCTWKVPFDKAASRDLRAWGTVGRVFASFFPDAREITLLEGSLPPGIEINVQRVQWQSRVEQAPGFYGTPTKTGLYEAKVNVTLASGATETRWARFVIAEEEITQSQEELVAQPGQDQTLAFFNGHSGEIFQVEQINGTIPPGLTMFSDGGRPRFCGTPMQTGRFSAAFRIVLSSGKVIDHTVNVTVPAKYGVSSETISLFVGEENRTFLNFDGSDQVRNMECISGELPPGVSFGYSMSEAPNYSGIPQTAGTYPAVFRVSLLNGKTVTHMVTAVVLNEAPSLPVYTMDLSLGGTSIPRTDMDTWLSRSLACAANAGQITMETDASGVTRLNLDKKGAWDVSVMTKSDGSLLFRQEDGSSLTEEDFTLKLSPDAIVEANALWESDHSARYAKEIAFHLKDSYDLYIAGTQVTSLNREDILGNGVFSFDGVNTLIIQGDCDYTGGEPLIRNRIEGLIVRTESDSSLSCWDNCIETTGSLSLTGAGQLNLQSSGNSGIVCEKALLEIYNTTLMIQAKKKGVTGIGDAAVHARADRANVSVRSGEGAMDGFWSIGLTNCMVTSPLRGDKGTIGSRACLVSEDGELLKDARITAYEKKYGLMIDGVPVTDRNRTDVLKNGIFSFDGDHTLTISGSYEDAKNIIVDSRIDGLVICAAPDTVLRTTKMSCLSLSGNTMLTGGPLTVISDNKWLSQGIDLQNDSRLFVCDMDLTVRGNRRGISGGSDTAKGTLDVWASNVTVSGPTTAIWVPGGLELEQCILETPEGGTFNETDGKVYDAGGDPAAEVSIKSFRTWELYLAGTQVTERNMSDILDDGTFSFDGNRTLTVKGNCSSENGVIESYIPGLILSVEKDAILETGEGADPIFAGANLTITGPGKLTLISGCAAAVTQRGGSILTIRDADVSAQGPYGLWGGEGETLMVENASVTVRGTDGAILDFGNGITLTGCEITAPAGGKVKNGAVVTSGGTVAEEVTIVPVTHVTGVTLDKTSLTLITGKSGTLKATVKPSDAADKTVSWSSSRPAVAAVSSSGKVTAKAEGTAVITVTTKDGGKTAACTVTVKAPTVPVTGVTLDKTSLTLIAGKSGTLKATVKPSDASDTTVTWESSEPTVAVVSSGGKVTGVAPGSAVITVRSADGGKTAYCVVTVQAETVPIGEGAISVSGEVMAYSVWLPGGGEPARLIAAWYDGNGRMLGCTVEDVVQDGLKTGIITVKKDQKEYRLFALDRESGKPLTKVLTTGG
ncbi:MAG: Ig domain-containing protein [Clostridia bacterium]|nr:Ig domain-containing protein [Clostridia bacterium]